MNQPQKKIHSKTVMKEFMAGKSIKKIARLMGVMSTVIEDKLRQASKGA